MATKEHQLAALTTRKDEGAEVTISFCEHCQRQASDDQALAALPCTVEATGLAPFWSDSFDMDLLKLWPVLHNMLGELGKTTMWTFGGEWAGRLNHPAVWDMSMGPVAMFWKDKPEHIKEQGGAFKISEAMVTRQPMIEATWLEVLRDAWSHGFIVFFEGEALFNGAGPEVQNTFNRIMLHIRDIETTSEFYRLKNKGLSLLMSSHAFYQGHLARLKEIDEKDEPRLILPNP